MGKFLQAVPMLIAGCFTSLLSVAQTAAANQPVEMADTMRSNGKIYVVVAVLSTVLIGIVLYLVRLEKKVKALEKQQAN